MKLINPNKFFLLWYFLNLEKRRKEKYINKSTDELEYISLFVYVAREHVISLIKEKYIVIPKLSFDDELLTLNNLKKTFNKIKTQKIKNLISKNSFTYEEYFLIEEELFKVDGKNLLKNNVVLTGYLIRKDTKVNADKISLFLKTYSEQVVSKETFTTSNYETFSIKELVTAGTLKEILISQIKKDITLMYGNISKNIKKTIKEELSNECTVDYIETLDNQFVFLPTMYYMEMVGNIKIVEIYPDHHYFKVTFFLEENKSKVNSEDQIYIIECTKVNKKTNEFIAYINTNYDKGITFKLSTRYAKVLYNIASEGKYEIETNIKSATGYMRNLNTKKKPVSSLLYSTMKNLKEKKIVRIVSRTIVATDDVVIKLK